MKIKLLKKTLIPKRGGMQVGVMRAGGDLGFWTAAVYSDADRNAIHTRYADEAHHIGGPAPSDSYLQPERIAKVAHDCPAEAIHPAYGFLSGNAAFPAACDAAGSKLIWPPPTPRRPPGHQ